jgi:hypothetical protein
MVKAFYIVSRGGEPLYFYDFVNTNSSIVNAALFSGMISAIQGFLKETDHGQVSQFDTNINRIHISPSSIYVYVLVVDRKSKFTQEAIDQLFSQLKRQITLDYNVDSPFTISQSENQLIDQIVQVIFSHWEKEYEESEATKKMKDALW